MPHLRALVQRMQGRPFVLLAVNSYDSEEVFRKGVPEFGVTWPVAFQGDATPIADLYRVEGYPTMYVLDQDGRVAAVDLRGEELAAKIEELVSALEKKR
jgi:hypothetical protein